MKVGLFYVIVFGKKLQIFVVEMLGVEVMLVFVLNKEILIEGQGLIVVEKIFNCNVVGVMLGKVLYVGFDVCVKVNIVGFQDIIGLMIV